MHSMQTIYLDANATTPMRPEVWQAMQPLQSGLLGNAASTHWAGRAARKALEDARERLAGCLGADPDEVIFTSGATEANNLALLGLAGSPPGSLLASPIEHPCVLEPLRQLQTRGFQLHWFPVAPTGQVHLDPVETRAREATPDSPLRLVSLMLVNHETGVVQPVAELTRALVNGPRPTPVVHCDAAQAVGKVPVHFHQLGVTALTISGHKCQGPTGIGALLLRRGQSLQPQFWGGHQQQGRRPGTEAVALAVGLATAVEHACLDLDAWTVHATQLRVAFLATLKALASPLVVHGFAKAGPWQVAPTVNVAFPGCSAELLLVKLDLAGIACSTGSACSSGSLLPSPVLQAMQVPEAALTSAMRFSFPPGMTLAEVEEAGRRIGQAVVRLRAD